MVECDRCGTSEKMAFQLFSIFKDEPWVCESCLKEFVREHKEEWMAFAHGQETL